MYLIFDGGNGGHKVMVGYGSFHLYDVKGGKLLMTGSFQWNEPMTNNEAEYKTLLSALEKILEIYPYPSYLLIEGDSELVRNQVSGIWQITIKGKHLQLYRDAIRALLQNISYEYNHIPRDEVVAVLGH
jgi:ribonuclease HI